MENIYELIILIYDDPDRYHISLNYENDHVNFNFYNFSCNEILAAGNIKATKEEYMNLIVATAKKLNCFGICFSQLILNSKNVCGQNIFTKNLRVSFGIDENNISEKVAVINIHKNIISQQETQEKTNKQKVLAY